VARVVAAVEDPFEKVRGRGIAAHAPRSVRGWLRSPSVPA
jgi:hypothetical protein